MRLKDKVIVVTGGVSGIGKESVLKMIKEGAKVVIADINAEKGTEVVDEIKQAGGEVSFVQTDVSKYSEVENLVQKTVDMYGTIDVMFNNAGMGIPKPLLEHVPEKDYDRVISINQNGVYYGILAAAKKMVELGVQGTIINTASVYAVMAAELTFSYHASKGAVLMMTKSAALELAKHKIRVVAIAPGRVETPILNAYKDLGVWDHVVSEQMRGLTQPEEIANVVAFLASDEANVINGTCVMVDDGFTSFKTPLL
ncbi:SDR family NAD(P)-dependent oxidoreductase [Bacillus sp. Hm123]|uniref:SDR family NAD(P)-dependent oxidoreductase n=1 Tax=Bacillus sp. Hm123 TaxID=3450745 RepID=UPI003F42F10B